MTHTLNRDDSHPHKLDSHLEETRLTCASGCACTEVASQQSHWYGGCLDGRGLVELHRSERLQISTWSLIGFSLKSSISSVKNVQLLHFILSLNPSDIDVSQYAMKFSMMTYSYFFIFNFFKLCFLILQA